MKVRFDRCRLPEMLVVFLGLVAGMPLANAKDTQAVMDGHELQSAILRSDLGVAEQQIAQAIGRHGQDWAAAKAVVQSAGLDNLGREYLLHQVLMRARHLEPDEEALQFVSSLQDYDSEVYVWHAEGPLPVVAYPIGTLATGTLQIWAQQRVRNDALREFQSGIFSSLEHLGRSGTNEYAGVIAALKDADPVAAGQAKAWLEENASAGGFYEARAIVALVTADKNLISELTISGDGPAAIELVRAVPSRFDAGSAFDVLVRATANPAVASAAMFEIDGLRKHGLGARVDQYLLDQLDDPELGATAAAIISRSGDLQLLGRIAEALTSATSTPAYQARATLALTLANNQYSRTVLLDALENDVFIDPNLRSKVVKWLQN